MDDNEVFTYIFFQCQIYYDINIQFRPIIRGLPAVCGPPFDKHLIKACVVNKSQSELETLVSQAIKIRHSFYAT